MKKLIQLFDYLYQNVTIKWHKPVKLPIGRRALFDQDQTDVFLYKILAKRGEIVKLIYIGMSEKQNIEDRLYNKDHQVKQEFMKEENNGYVLYCSLGEFVQNGDDTSSFRWSKKHVKLIEKMLIISHSDDHPLINKKGISWFGTDKEWIQIKNTGYLKDGMFKVVSYGLSTS
jgi:hypothetical protein